ncbi:MAG: rhodanese-like domain-containing protein [Bacteroidota bacterium]|jgi:phage shock protein E|nr:rhodanese-like domain-containing protein [Sphingobacteriales bacterium]
MRFVQFLSCIGLVFIAVVSSAQSIKNSAKQNIQLVSPKVFHERLQKGGVILIDVRTSSEFKKGHLKGARLLDIFNDDFEKQINKLDRKLTYMVYCGIGGRSEECTELMRKKGFISVYDLDGGIKRWLNEGFPIEL